MTTRGIVPRLSSSTIRVVSVDSSRISVMPSTRLSWTKEAILMNIAALFTLKGTLLMMIRSRPPSTSSTSVSPRIFIMPRPVVIYLWMPSRPIMMPPPGKSGPGIIFKISLMLASGFSMSIQITSINSPRLCGGIFVVMPTAIPVEPFINKLGSAAGRTAGSVVLSL